MITIIGKIMKKKWILKLAIKSFEILERKNSHTLKTLFYLILYKKLLNYLFCMIKYLETIILLIFEIKTINFISFII